MPPSATLNDLPNELLLLILRDLDPPSLIAVSCLCKRINAVALAQILSPHADFYGLRSITLPLRFGAPSRLPFNSIPALRFFFSMKQPVGFFYCQFSLGEYVKEVEQPPAAYSPTYCGTAISSLLRHLHCVQCHTLDINNASQIEYVEGTKFDGPIVNTLKDITLSGAHFMLSEYFRDWTVSTMNLSPLTEVWLVNVDIRALLSSLFLPSLQKLVIRYPDLHLSDITSFLSRHSTTDNLMLRVTCDDASLPLGSFPELKPLSSSAECLSQLFSSPDSMLQLRSVTCYGSVILFSIAPPPSSAVQTIFQNIALHGTITTLDVPLSDLNMSEEWLSVTPRYEHLLTGTTTLYIDSSMSARTESATADTNLDPIESTGTGYGNTTEAATLSQAGRQSISAYEGNGQNAAGKISNSERIERGEKKMET
ncbi:hypothetical protein DFS33DRAFT_1388293 [Desarmillaria ectypa]|nr:hypothetical protein DFS33DRAFT_1388293 [Desarmillaria ectypa]